MKAALKEQVLRLRPKHTETKWYSWNELLLKLMRTLQIADNVTSRKQYPTTHEELCGNMAEGDEDRYALEIIPTMRRDAFGRIMYHGTG